MLNFRKNSYANSEKTYGQPEGQTEGWMEWWTDPTLKYPSGWGRGSKETLVEWFWWFLVLVRLANLCQISKLVIVQGCLVQCQQYWVVNPNDKFLFNSGW